MTRTGGRRVAGAVALIALMAMSGCGDRTGPEDQGPPEEYAFVLTGDAGISIGGEVAAYALEDGALLEVREILGGTLDGSDHAWEATAMVRAALEGGTLEPPPSSADDPAAVSGGAPGRPIPQPASCGAAAARPGRGGALCGPAGLGTLHSGLAGAPVPVTVGGRTALVVGMEFTLQMIAGSGTLTLQGTVNGEVEVSGSATAAGQRIGTLILGSVPGV